MTNCYTFDRFNFGHGDGSEWCVCNSPLVRSDRDSKTLTLDPIGILTKLPFGLFFRKGMQDVIAALQKLVLLPVCPHTRSLYPV